MSRNQAPVEVLARRYGGLLRHDRVSRLPMASLRTCAAPARDRRQCRQGHVRSPWRARRLRRLPPRLHGLEEGQRLVIGDGGHYGNVMLTGRSTSALQPTYNGPHKCDWLRRRVLVLRRLALRDRGQHAGHKVLGACRPAQVQPRRRLRYAGSRGARIAYQTLAGALEPDILLLHGGFIPIQSMARYSKFAVFSVSWHP